MSVDSAVLRNQILAARAAARTLAALSGPGRAALLGDLASALLRPAAQELLFAANAQDLTQARADEAAGLLGSALVKRLGLDADKLASCADGLRQLARMPELIGRRLTHRELDEGLVLQQVSCPLGVLGVVFEARPDALVQITGLGLKSGNAVALKGGREARASNRALTEVIHGVLTQHGIDPRAVVLLEERAEVDALLAMDDVVDLMIARGSSSFIHHVRGKSRIPVMAHADGICHLFLHAAADRERAVRVTVDSKVSYPAACNAVETLLWEDGAEGALEACVKALAAAGVELRGCGETRRFLNLSTADMKPASEDDWDTEYGALILSIKKVAGLEGALAHIEGHGSRHTEAIVTEDGAAAARFLAEVDAACVFHNASTRFSDGYRFGLGAEVGISTDKLHARGPVGVEGLLTYRWLLSGSGQATGDYGPGKRPFRHRDLPAVAGDVAGENDGRP
jgi:glutamate-5-semialdehyde dehydrogenase